MGEEKGEEDVKKITNASEAFESLLASVGSTGKWQWKITFLCGFCGFFTSLHNMGAVFLAATPDHRCEIPLLDEGNMTSVDLYDEVLNFTIPWVTDKYGKRRLSECLKYDRDYAVDVSIDGLGPDSSNVYDIIAQENTTQSMQIKCPTFHYDQSIYKSTVISEWDLVCDEKRWKPTIQATYMMGILAGAVIASAFSDRFGRRPSTIGCALVFFSCSVITAFSIDLDMFIIFRFLVAGAGQGMYLINFVIVMEITGLKHRDLYGNFYTLGWTAGCTLLAMLAFFFREWRSLQLATSVPTVVLLSYYWLMPESPRWLLMQGRFKEGLVILEDAGKCNGGKELPKEAELQSSLDIIQNEVLQNQETEKVSFMFKLNEYIQNLYKLVKTPNMRKRSLIMFYNWFIVSMCYYGISFSGENIGVSLYTLSFLGAIIEVPGTAMCYYMAIKFGRRITLCFSMIAAGLSCFAILLVPTHLGWLNMTLALIGRMFLGSGFTSVFFFSTELVPTNIRNVSIGTASMFARIGSAIGPYVVDLLGNIYYAIPSTVFGVLSVIAGLLALFLPETRYHGFPETIEEIERLPR